MFETSEPKKHSVCYKTSDKKAAVQSIYVMCNILGTPVPKKIKITIEEVN